MLLESFVLIRPLVAEITQCAILAKKKKTIKLIRGSTYISNLDLDCLLFLNASLYKLNNSAYCCFVLCGFITAMFE